MTEPKYNGGGVIPGEPVQVRIQVGERMIKPDGTVYELQAIEGGCQWVEIGYTRIGRAGFTAHDHSEGK